MIDDTSLEFDMFEDIRRKLVEVFVREGRARLEAEKIALYVVQGVRDVPKLLTVLTEEEGMRKFSTFARFLATHPRSTREGDLIGLDHRTRVDVSLVP